MQLSSPVIIPRLIVTAMLLITATFRVDASEAKQNQATVFKFSSSRCVALRQGQTCYSDIKISWRIANKQDVCLVDSTQETRLKCWSGQASGIFEFEFQSPESRDYVLRTQRRNVDLAHHRIQVAWVYKASKRTKSSWRLF